MKKSINTAHTHWPMKHTEFGVERVLSLPVIITNTTLYVIKVRLLFSGSLLTKAG